MNEYLPHITKEWCTEQIKQMGFPKGRVEGAAAQPDGSRVHATVYKQLRSLIQSHINSRKAPQLMESNKPTGAWQYELQERTINHQTGDDDSHEMDMDIHNEGVDVLAVENDFPDTVE